jgi:lipooligosaccharide transport system permease protein
MYLPPLSLRFVPVWRRNLRVWRKLMVPSLLGNFGEPLLYLLALGYGFGLLIGEVDGLPYMVFLASGIVCSSAMTAASFEAMYSGYTRMEMQQTWAAMMNAPLEIEDVVLGEVLWAGTKALINSAAILIVATSLGLVAGWQALWVLPIVLLAGVCFASLAMVVTALSRSYDFFMYYFTLVITPMFLLSGVFFPLDTLPAAIAQGAMLLPLAHIVALIRPLMIGAEAGAVALHLSVVLGYTAAGFWLAAWLLRRRLRS